MRHYPALVGLLFSIGTTGTCFARQAELLTFSSGGAEQRNFNQKMVLEAMQQLTNSVTAGTTRRDGHVVAHSDVQFGSLDKRPCEWSSYVPTWWLAPSVEARRATFYPAMARIACEFGIPVDLMDAVIAQESGYNPFAISGAGAMGMMQIMPGTARSLGLLTPWNAMANMRSGARYLRAQLDRFGTVELALAAYNAGPERRSLTLGRIPAIPQTLGYVRAITTNWVRLAANRPASSAAELRAAAASSAVRAAGYRDISLSVYEGNSASNPI